MSVSEIVVKYHFSFKRPNFNKLKLGKSNCIGTDHIGH